MESLELLICIGFVLKDFLSGKKSKKNLQRKTIKVVFTSTKLHLLTL